MKTAIVAVIGVTVLAPVWSAGDNAPRERRNMSDQQPLRINDQPQLFIDDGLIESSSGVKRIVNQPRKYSGNPVLTYEYPWEGNCVITWGSVLYDRERGLFRMWYQTYLKLAPADKATRVCYAESSDGIKWRKPMLELYKYGDSARTNIVFDGLGEFIDSPTVLEDPFPSTPDRRFRLFWHCSEGIRTASSADGIHWKPYGDVVVKAGDRNTASYDVGRHKWMVITRVPGRKIRTCGLWESDDGERFDYVGEILAPDEEDPKKTELYGMIRFNHPSGLRLGFLEMFFVPIRKLNTQLVYSRHGLNWRRACDRQTFLEWGPPGSWDQAWVTPSHNPPIRVGNELYIYYQGRSTLHWAEKPYGHIGSIGLAFLRPDGYVSFDAQYQEGYVVTAPLMAEGKTLAVNALARPGYVVAEVLNASGKPIEGLTRDDCVPLEGADALEHTFEWKSGKDLSATGGEPFRLRFFLRGAKLYAFRVR